MENDIESITENNIENLSDAPTEENIENQSDAPTENESGKVSLKVWFKTFTQKHANIWQLIKFTMISCIAAVVELGSYYMIDGWLAKGLNDRSFHWFVFNYDGGGSGGLGTMIAFLVSTTLAQITSFITNRKATFKANNNVVFSAIAYTVMVVGIIILQTWSGPIIVEGINNGIHMTELSSFLGKFIWMFLSFVIVFLSDKFVIMRKKKDKGEATDETVTDGENSAESNGLAATASEQNAIADVGIEDACAADVPCESSIKDVKSDCPLESSESNADSAK